MKLTSTRQAIHDALSWGYLQKSENGIVEYLTYLCKIQKSQRQNDPNLDFMEVGYICAAIDTLSKPLRGWLEFCYGPEDSKSINIILGGYVWNMMFKISNAKRYAKQRALCECAVEDFRLGVMQHKTLPIQIYSDRMEVSESNFSRDWGDQRRQCLRVVQVWDTEAVGHASRMIKSLRGDSDNRPSEVLRDLQNEGYKLEYSQA
jgi:hypothetical protein